MDRIYMGAISRIFMFTTNKFIYAILFIIAIHYVCCRAVKGKKIVHRLSMCQTKLCANQISFVNTCLITNKEFLPNTAFQKFVT